MYSSASLLSDKSVSRYGIDPDRVEYLINLDFEDTPLNTCRRCADAIRKSRRSRTTGGENNEAGQDSGALLAEEEVTTSLSRKSPAWSLVRPSLKDYAYQFAVLCS
ncbi:hypothetical protein EVAR_78321_1 [Eumeta japonica]|uniref:Uncharacterized protein n=1 Tax=Eumeta variegata TaxID=151549 RepID=A0A4C1T489_EUMVA|nr:hypothetical protein EVAR_78321_1 [Eumeta japonica]